MKSKRIVSKKNKLKRNICEKKNITIGRLFAKELIVTFYRDTVLPNPYYYF